MTQVAFTVYGPNTEYLPEEWPKDLVEVPDGQTLADVVGDTTGWTEVSIGEYNQYRADLQDVYDALQVVKPPPTAPIENVDARGNPVVSVSVYGYVKEKTCFKGYRYEAVASDVSIFDEVINTQVFLQGGTAEVDNATDGDYIEFAIVDKDDVLGYFTMLGLTVGQDVLEVNKYIKTQYLKTGSNKVENRVPVAGKVLQGLYFRLMYHSVGTTPNPIVRVTYLWYENGA